MDSGRSPFSRIKGHKVAYLVYRLPALSHTHIHREIIALEERGLLVYPISIQPSDRSLDVLAKEERRLLKRTRYLGKVQGLGTVTTCLSSMMHSPQILWSAIKFMYDIHKTWLPNHLAMSEWVQAHWVGACLKQHQVQHIHIHFHPYVARIAILVKKLYGISFSMSVHGPEALDPSTIKELNMGVQLSHFVMCSSRYIQSQLMVHVDSIFWPKMNLVPFGVDVNLLNPSLKKTPLDQKTFHMISIGHLTPANGFNVLLKAFARFIRSHPHSHLTIVGHGHMRVQLLQTAKTLGMIQHITFAGAHHHEDIIQLMTSSDVMVMTCLSEDLPMVLMEAMAIGLPCVAPWVAGIPEIIKHEETGLLVAPADADALSQAMQRIASDESLRENIMVAARQKVLRHFNMEMNINHMIRCYDRLYWQNDSGSGDIVALPVGS
jgi:glycosyltransferase involved in cell wall biosynthesis